MYSGGVGSYIAAKRVIREFGVDNTVLLFCDTNTEDEDLYRFLYESAAFLGAHLEVVSDGRDVWRVFDDERYIGNSRIDPCSKLLKRIPANNWIKQNYNLFHVVRYVGIDWTEEHRYIRMRNKLLPWRVEAPLLQPPLLSKPQMIAEMELDGIQPPRLYELGFSHNNCGGFCVKAGKAHFKNLLIKLRS